MNSTIRRSFVYLNPTKPGCKVRYLSYISSQCGTWAFLPYEYSPCITNRDIISYEIHKNVQKKKEE